VNDLSIPLDFAGDVVCFENISAEDKTSRPGRHRLARQFVRRL
jgi:hypothetical protein